MQTLDDFLEFAKRATNYELRSPTGKNAGQGHRFNLQAMEHMLARLDHPDRSPAHRILVAGTHGKGSVCHWIDGYLSASGLSTGRYQSPHVEHLLERVLIRGQPIAERDWMRAARPAADAFTSAESAGLVPTFFDLVTCLALVAFRNARVEAVILEVGLGGRLDSTNAITPTVSVITEIDYDHMEILGNTLTEIAREKAGIMRRGAPVLVQVSAPEARGALEGAAREIGASPAIFLDPDAMLAQQPPSPGRHQRRNAALAAEAAAQALGHPLSADELTRGLQLAGPFQARCQQVVAASGRSWLLDGGHTPGAVRALVEVLHELRGDSRLCCVFGASQDKRAGVLLEILAPAVNHLIACPFDSPRSTPPEQLAKLARAAGIPEVTAARSIPEALAQADAESPPEQPRLVAGSFYLVGEVLRGRMLEAL